MGKGSLSVIMWLSSTQHIIVGCNASAWDAPSAADEQLCSPNALAILFLCFRSGGSRKQLHDNTTWSGPVRTQLRRTAFSLSYKSVKSRGGRRGTE